MNWRRKGNDASGPCCKKRDDKQSTHLHESVGLVGVSESNQCVEGEGRVSAKRKGGKGSRSAKRERPSPSLLKGQNSPNPREPVIPVSRASDVFGEREGRGSLEMFWERRGRGSAPTSRRGVRKTPTMMAPVSSKTSILSVRACRLTASLHLPLYDDLLIQESLSKNEEKTQRRR